MWNCNPETNRLPIWQKMSSTRVDKKWSEERAVCSVSCNANVPVLLTCTCTTANTVIGSLKSNWLQTKCKISGFAWFETRAAVGMRCALFGDFTQRRMVVSGQPIGPLLRTSWPLKVGPVGFPETSARNCLYALRKIPKERRYRFRVSLPRVKLLSMNYGWTVA
jgi:hypothetical protein